MISARDVFASAVRAQVADGGARGALRIAVQREGPRSSIDASRKGFRSRIAGTLVATLHGL